MLYKRNTKFKKVARYARRQVVGRLRKRYVRGNGNFKVNKLISDVSYLKSSLNTERKHIDFHITNLLSANALEPNAGSRSIRAGVARPTRNSPVIYRLALPERGVAYNQRIGNQIKITNIHAKFQIERLNKQNYQTSCHWKFFLFFVKAGDEYSPTIDQLFEQDVNGNYTPMCRTNGQEFKKFYRPKMLTKSGKIIEQVNGNNQGACHYKYCTISQKMSTKVMFDNAEYKTYVDQEPSDQTNNVDDFPCVEAMRPYICFLSDDNSGGSNNTTADQDTLDFTGNIRISYVDN